MSYVRTLCFLIALAMMNGSCFAQTWAGHGTAMSSPIDTSRAQLQEAFRLRYERSGSPLELGSGYDASFYQNQSALTPQAREKLAEALNSRYSEPASLYYCNAQVRVIAFWKEVPQASKITRAAEEKLARRRVQAMFTWFIEHGYDRELLIGEVRAGVPADMKADDAFYQIGAGFLTASECEEFRQDARADIRKKRSSGFFETPP